MAAYAAVVSLKNTIERLVNSPRISLVSSTREILESAYDMVKSVQKVLLRSDESSSSSKADLEEEMRDAASRLEDVLESHLSNLFLSHHPLCLSFSVQLQDLEVDDILSFVATLKKMEEVYAKESDNPSSPVEQDDDNDDGGGGGDGAEMVGLLDQFLEIRGKLLDIWAGKTTHTIVGMAGMGKTTLARKIFEDPLVKKQFKTRVFLKVGQKYKLQDIKKAIDAQVKSGGLIVLDDLWNHDVWNHIRIYHFTEIGGTRILVTTRLGHVAQFIERWMQHGGLCTTDHMRFLNNAESWNLLCGKVFAEQGQICPPQLEKSGKKIAENCEGLPLLVITVANLLHEEPDKTPEFWKKVAENKENPIFMKAYEQILKVLYPSYNYLPQYLKQYFLYMGAFPQNYNVRFSKLINLWNAEGFVDTNTSQSLEQFATKGLSKLVSDNVVMIHQRSSTEDRGKEYSVHSVFWHLCKQEGTKSKFLHILKSSADCKAQGMESQRRLSIHKNILFCMKDVFPSTTSISTVRSLLCTGPYHQYQVPISLGCLGLLRVLYALTIRFYEFPEEVLQLVQLRYLALTYNGGLPSSIFNLWNLEYLIIHRHLSIKLEVAKSYMPSEIWYLKKLKYLEIPGRNLHNPPRGVVLPNLLTLLDVGVHSCTKGVFQSIPNLQKLRVQIELSPHQFVPMTCPRIPFRSKLESVKFVVMNPTLKSWTSIPRADSHVTEFLKKLTLSGLGYPWEDMKTIEELPFLEVLKLQCYAFRGKTWKVEKGYFAFRSLKYLLIEDTDLEQWIIRKNALRSLCNLCLKNCYKLREMPKIPSLPRIELVDCNPLAVTSAKKMKNCYVYESSSWIDKNFKS